MTTVSCLDCPTVWTSEDIEGGLKDGSLRERVGAYGTRTFFGICDACQAKHSRATPKPQVDQFVLLRETMALVREKHPNWPLTKCSKETVRILNNPWLEPNIGFRAYLLERDDS